MIADREFVTTTQSNHAQGQLWQVRVGGTPVGVVVAQPTRNGGHAFTVSCDDSDPTGIFLGLDARLGQRIVAARAGNGSRGQEERAWGTLDQVLLPTWDETGTKASIRCVVIAGSRT